MQLVGNVEPLQQDCGVAFGCVAVFFADNAFEFAQLHAIGVGNLRLLINSVPLLHRGPQALVAHDHRIDRRVRVKGELILAEHSQFARTDHRPFLRLEFAAEQFHERGFTRAVGPGQAIAFARRECRGDFIEQNFGAVAHGDIAD